MQHEISQDKQDCWWGWRWPQAPALVAPVSAQSIAAQTNKITELERAGKFADALTLAQKTVTDAEKAHGPVHRDVAAVLNNFGHVYASLGQDVEAEPLYKRALAIFEKVGGLDSADVSPTLNNLAALYQRQDRFADAEPLFRRALAHQRKIARPQPSRHRPFAEQSRHLLREARTSQRFRAVVQARAGDLRESRRAGASGGRHAAQQSRPGRQGDWAAMPRPSR